jgi:Fe-S-cluster-containing dehydrogenase component
MSGHALIIDYKYCTGCFSCELACRQEKGIEAPEEWGVRICEIGPERLGGEWYWNHVPVPSSLCDLCASRLDAGLKPACVHHCLAQCMEAVPLADLPARLAAAGRGVACFMP